MSTDDTPPRVWFADGLLFVERTHRRYDRSGYDIVQIRPHVYAGGIETALPADAVELRPVVTHEPPCDCGCRGVNAVPAVPETVEPPATPHSELSVEGAVALVKRVAPAPDDAQTDVVAEAINGVFGMSVSYVKLMAASRAVVAALASGGADSSRVAAAEAVQVRMADSLPDSGPVDSWSERDRAVRHYEGELSAALAAES